MSDSDGIKMKAQAPADKCAWQLWYGRGSCGVAEAAVAWQRQKEKHFHHNKSMERKTCLRPIEYFPVHKF